MRNSNFTRRFYAPMPERFLWLVIAYEDASLEVIIEAATPSEEYIRRALGLKSDIPIIIGCHKPHAK